MTTGPDTDLRATDRASWPQIDNIVVNHGADAPPPCSDLEGRHFNYTVGDATVELIFGRGMLRWNEGAVAMDFTANVYPSRSGYFLVDCTDLEAGRSLSLVIDLVSERILIIDVRAPAPGVPGDVLERVRSRNSQSAVSVRYRHGASNASAENPQFKASDLLIGKQFRFTYSDTHVYDHLYLSERYYTWFCRRGPDQGLGDFEECDYFDLGPNLVLIVWREKLLPCVGITIEDHHSMRSVGKIFGADSYTGLSAGSIVGASIHFIADISGGEIPSGRAGCDSFR